MLRLDGVTVRHRRAAAPALDRLDLAVEEGEAVALVGRSGAGKSTALHVALGLRRPDAGAVTWRGEPLPQDRAGLRAWRRQVQHVPQDPAGSLSPRRRIGSTLHEPLRALRVPGDHDALVREALAAVDLSPELLGRRPAEISGGQAQRVALARALAVGARLLLADEPLSSLDPALTADLLGLLERLRHARGLGLVLVAHDLAAVRRLCDRTVVLEAGAVVEQGSTAHVLETPRHPLTAAIVAAP